MNSIGDVKCLGGSKSSQLGCQTALAQKHGCDFSSLRLQPLSFDLRLVDHCNKLVDLLVKNENTTRMWAKKPHASLHGLGITIYTSSKDILRDIDVKSCYKNKRKALFIVQEYIHNPALLEGKYKFDFRTYLLIASVKPTLLFFHEGFGRKADQLFNPGMSDVNTHVTNAISQSTDNHHFWSFREMREDLRRSAFSTDNRRDYFETSLIPQLKRATRFAFEAHRNVHQISRRKGTFHMIGFDWTLDQDGHVFLLEGNNGAAVVDYQNVEGGFTPRIWDTLVDLILLIHTTPQELPSRLTVKQGFAFHGWELIYNELEEMRDVELDQNRRYNACSVVQQ